MIHWLITYNCQTNIVDILEIQIIDGDQKDDFPLREVHLKKHTKKHIEWLAWTVKPEVNDLDYPTQGNDKSLSEKITRKANNNKIIFIDI